MGQDERTHTPVLLSYVQELLKAPACKGRPVVPTRPQAGALRAAE